MVLDDDHNTRAVITANDGTTLTLDRAVDAAAGQRVAIVASDAYFDWSREDSDAPNVGRIHQWANLPTEEFYSREAEGELKWAAAPAPVIKEAVTYLHTWSGGSENVTNDPQAVDIIVDQPWGGELPDRFFTPLRFRTWRGIQEAIEALLRISVAPYFVAPVDYTGKKAIPRLTLAGALPNGHDYTMSGATTLDISGEAPYLPLSVCVTVSDPAADGEITAAGDFFEVGTDGVIDFGGAVGAAEAPLDVRVTWGWTRTVAREFINFYARTAFVPDTTETGAATTPTETYPGTWQTRPASTRYRYCDAHGHVFDSPLACDVFEVGKLARYVGGNFHDAAIRVPTRQKVGAAYADAAAAQLVAFIEGIDGLARSGGVVAGDTFWIDTGADWWAADPMLVHEGTADGGSSVSLTDSTQAASAFWTHPEKGRWLGWIIEVQVGGVWVKRVITAHTGATVGWDEALPATADGCAYRIAEPMAFPLNRWAGRTLRLTKPDGTSMEAAIVASDASHVFFEAIGEAAGEGWTWAILEAEIGTTWMGADDGEGGVVWEVPDPETYPADTRNLPPDTLTRFGRLVKGDYFNETLFVEARDVLNQLTATRNGAFNWIGKDEANENNDVSIVDYSHGATPAIAKSAAEAASAVAWAAGPYAVGDVAPYVSSNSTIWYEDDVPRYNARCNADRAFAYGQKAGIPMLLDGEVDFYTMGTFDLWDTGTSESVFNAFGDPVLYHLWKKFDTETLADPMETVKFGSVDYPGSDWHGGPYDPYTDYGRLAGYAIAGTETVTRWSMAYVAE